MLYAGGHCHAPSCIDIRLYRNDTGTPQLICHQMSTFGKGHVSADKFDEADYLTLPPCLWGDNAEGLAPPSWLPPNTPMYSIKRNRNTCACGASYPIAIAPPCGAFAALISTICPVPARAAGMLDTSVRWPVGKCAASRFPTSDGDGSVQLCELRHNGHENDWLILKSAGMVVATTLC